MEEVDLSVSEQVKSEISKLSKMSLKEKLEHIWTYYKFLLIAIAVIVIVAVSIIGALLNPDPPTFASIAFYEVYLGDAFDAEFKEILTGELIGEGDNSAITTDFMFSGGDPSAEMAMVQKLMAIVSSRSLDIIIAENENIEQFIAEGYFMPVASAGLEVPEEYLVYGSTSDDDDDDAPLAYAVNLAGSGMLRDLGIRAEALSLGIVVNTERPENAASIAVYILGAG